MANWTVKTVATNEVVSRGWPDAIVEFDKRNMRDIFAEAGIPFPEAKRRKGFEAEGVFFIAFSPDGHIAGYLELVHDWECAEDLYISSLQIAPDHRNGILFRHLLAEGIHWLRQRSFRCLKTHVQKNNRLGVDLYRRLGFTFSDNPKSDKSFVLTADHSILEASFAKRLTR